MRREDVCRRRSISGMFLALALVFGLAAGCVYREARGMQRQMSFYLQEGVAPEVAKQASDMSAKTTEGMEGQTSVDMDFCIWGETKEQRIMALQTGTAAQTDVVRLYGSSEWLFPGSGILPKGDREGCLIGADTARELFGSLGVVGEQVCWNDNVWVIRGIVQRPGHLLAVAGTYDGDTAFLNRITMGCGINGKNYGKGELLTMVYGLSAEPLRWDYLCDAKWLGELIPGKWSDFEGWSVHLEEKWEDIARLSEIEKSSLEMLYLHTCVKGLILGMASLFCFLAVLVHKLFYNSTAQK